MITSFTLSSAYHPTFTPTPVAFRLLEGGKFYPGDYVPCALMEENLPRINYLHWSAANRSGRNVDEQPNLLPIEHLAALSREEWIRLPKCLVPMDSFEIKSNIFSQLHHTKISHLSEDNFCVAGIWRTRTQTDGSTVNQLYLITAPTPSDMAVGGRRIPLVLPESQHRDWLQNELGFSRMLNGSVNYLNHHFGTQKIQTLIMEPAQQQLQRPAA